MDSSIPFQPDTASDPTHAGEWERTYAAWVHRASLIACVVAAVSAGIGFWAPSLVSLFMWLGKRDRSHFIDDHAKESLNFQISLAIYFGIVFVAGFITLGLAWILGGPFLLIMAFYGTLSAAKSAGRGEYYRYPMCFRFVS